MSDFINRQMALDALKTLEKPAPSPQHLSAIFDCEDAITALPSAEPERKGKCTKINCPIQMNYISNDCDIKTCPYRTEHKNGKWKNIALFTRECSECGAQFHELEYDNFCPNCGVDMRDE